MGMQQRRPQKLPDPKEMEKKTLDQYKKALKMLRDSLYNAKNTLENEEYGSYDATAVVNLGLIFFQLGIDKEQGLAKVKSLEEYIKFMKKHPQPK